MKILLAILAVLALSFFTFPIFPPMGQGCTDVVIQGQPGCTFHSETGYNYFHKGGTFKDLLKQ